MIPTKGDGNNRKKTRKKIKRHRNEETITDKKEDVTRRGGKSASGRGGGSARERSGGGRREREREGEKKVEW